MFNNYLGSVFNKNIMGINCVIRDLNGYVKKRVREDTGENIE